MTKPPPGRVLDLADVLSRPSRAVATKAPDFAAQRVRLEQRRGRIVGAIADGVLTHQDARQRLAEIDADTRALDLREARHGAATAPLDPDLRRAALADVALVRRAWPALTPRERQRMIGIFAASATIGRNAAGRRWERTGHALTVAWREISPALAPSWTLHRGRDLAGVRILLGAA